MKKIIFIITFVAVFAAGASTSVASDTRNPENRSGNPEITIQLKNTELLSDEFEEIKKDWENKKIEIKSSDAKAIGGFLVAGLWFILVVLILFLAAFIFWIVMLIHAIKHEIEGKAIWILILLLFYFVGALVYYFAVKRNFKETIKATKA